MLTALMGLLEAEDRAYAAIELESLALVHPWPDDDAAFDHLRLVSESFRRRGYPLLLVTATVEDAAYLDRTLRALAADDIRFVRLEAPVEVLRGRLTRREPPDWVGLPGLLERLEGLAASIASLPGVDLVVKTDAADARAVARSLRDVLQHP